MQIKDQTDGQFSHYLHAEPGALVGPKQKLIKAFDCTSPGAPRQDMWGICVRFAECQEATPSTPEVLAEIRCKGPALTVQLVRASEGESLMFRVAETDHALAKRALSRIDVPAGSRAELKPFKKRFVQAYVDL